MKLTKQDLKQLIEAESFSIKTEVFEGGGIGVREIDVVSVKKLKEFMGQFDENN